MRFAMLLLFLATPTPTTTPDEVALAVRPSGAVAVPVTLNGQGPFTFLLDTGASHTTVSAELAERLSLPVVARTRVSTTAGPEWRVVARLDHMAVGAAKATDLSPSLVPAAQLHALERGIDGVIGQDFLSAWDYTLDYRRRRLQWTVDAGSHTRLPLLRSGGRALVRLPATGRQAQIALVPDSGSNAFVIFERDGRTPLALRDTDEGFIALSGASRAEARGVVVPVLRVGDVTLRNCAAVVVTRPDGESAEGYGDGLLPLHEFASVSFSNSGSYMVVRR